MFLANRNQIPLITLELTEPSNQIESFGPTEYAKVGQKVLCYQSMKFSDMFDHYPPHTFVAKGTVIKVLLLRNLKSKGQGHSKNQKPLP